MGDINRMRGQMLSSSQAGSLLRIRAELPAATSLDYSETLLQFTGGRGGMSARLIGYRDAPDTVQETMPRRGVNPLDTAKYILAARSALDGGIFDF
jgi:ribosomal protection tetracycline resistance protein